MSFPAGPSRAGEAAVTKQQHSTTLSQPVCSGKHWWSSHTSLRSLLQLPLPLVGIAQKPFPCWKQLYEVWQELAQSNTTARALLLLRYWRYQEQKKPQTIQELKVVWALRGREVGMAGEQFVQQVCSLVALRKSCFFCWRKALLPLSPSINGCAAPRGAPAGWLHLPPTMQRNVQPLSSGSTHSKMDWNVFKIVSVKLEGQCRGKEVRKFRQTNAQNS